MLVSARVALLLSLPGLVSAAPAAEASITMRAVRLAAPLVLDGRLDETVYGEVPSTTDFVQQYPRGGEPATEQTEAWVFFDATHVYVALRCWDSQPDRMVADEMRRDNTNIWLNDNVIVVLDTFHDRRSAFFFQTNPLGGVRDALVINESSVNYDWNTVWDVRSQRTEHGWTTEMAIPFKSLRYPATSPQRWGFNVMRVVRSKNEQTLLSGVPPTYGAQGFSNLAFAAALEGIEPPDGTFNLQVEPYAIANATTNAAARRDDLDAAIGFDARYAVTSSLTLDFTYNTDFAQVEIDEQQVNLTRFSLFFPEKRDFFLEGQGVFDFAGSGARRATAVDDTPTLFFSRRIGLNEGQPIAIQAGARLMGRVGPTSIGVLNIQTEETPEADAAATNFSVVRIKHDVLRRSSVGLIATRRSPTIAGRGSNQVYGADANLVFFENLQINGYYATSETTGLSGDASSHRAQARYAADRYGLEVEHLKVGPAFNPEIGFMRRENFRRNYALARFSPRPRSLPGVRKLAWEASISRYTGADGALETQQEVGTFRTDLHNSDWFSVSYIHSHEVLPRAFRVAGGAVVPRGEYRFQEVEASYQLGPQRRVNGTFTLRSGGFFAGERTEFGYTGRARITRRFAVEPRAAVNWIDVPERAYRVTLLGARPTFALTPRMFVSALVQYNSALRSLEMNARLRWEYQPGSDLFLVYADGRDTAARGYPDLQNRAIAVKLSRFLQF